jgi:hypothetical protein
MIHDLSERYSREFSASVEAVRVGMAQEGANLVPVLLVKAISLTLKYLVRLRTFRLLIWKLPEGHLLYSLRIADDPTSPANLWSIIESDEELAAMTRIVGGAEVGVFLFNEQTINVCPQPRQL